MGEGQPTSVDVFAGVGGFTRLMGLCDARCVHYCESDPDAARVLGRRMADGCVPAAPIAPDIRAFACPAPVDVVTGGFPCQDVSNAGGKRGLCGARSALVWDLLRLADGSGARWLLAENVGALAARGLDDLVAWLEGRAWDVRTVVTVTCP